MEVRFLNPRLGLISRVVQVQVELFVLSLIAWGISIDEVKEEMLLAWTQEKMVPEFEDAGGAGGGGRVALLADGVITRGMINLNGGQGNADGAGYPGSLYVGPKSSTPVVLYPDFWNLNFGYWRFLVSFIWLTG